MSLEAPQAGNGRLAEHFRLSDIASNEDDTWQDEFQRHRDAFNEARRRADEARELGVLAENNLRTLAKLPPIEE